MDKDFESGDTNPFGLFLISMARWKKKNFLKDIVAIELWIYLKIFCHI